ncbi:hypothetical protein EMCRGX_G020679 [Ephydatia muelleri]
MKLKPSFTQKSPMHRSGITDRSSFFTGLAASVIMSFLVMNTLTIITLIVVSFIMIFLIMDTLTIITLIVVSFIMIFLIMDTLTISSPSLWYLSS